MLPTLTPGCQVLVDPRAYLRHAPTPGDIVVAEHPYRAGLVLIKRLDRIEPEGAILLGDNECATTDSRDFGPVPLHRLLGRVVSTL